MSKKSRKQKQTLPDSTTVTPSSSPRPHLGPEASPAVTPSYEYIQNKYNHLKSTSNELSTTVAFFEMFLDLQSQLKEMNAKLTIETKNACAKIDALEVKVRDLQNAVDNNPLEEKVAELELNLTNINSSMSKPNDKKSRNSCAICSKTFLKNADLEKHMSDHDATRDFECAVCGKKFFLDWRRKKHAQMHTVIPRTCRYFSSKMPCPFEDIALDANFRTQSFYSQQQAMLMFTNTQTSLSITTQRYTDSESRLSPGITTQRHTVSPRTDPPYPRM